MKFLTIIRHAKSSWDDPSLSDIVRPLNERGRTALPKVAAYLAQNKLIPDLFISSPATRALHTAIFIGEYLGYPEEKLLIKQEIYFGSINTIRELVKNVDNNFQHVFMTGHEPLLSSLIYSYTGNVVERFPTGAVCSIVFEENSWKLITKGIIRFITTPKEL